MNKRFYLILIVIFTLIFISCKPPQPHNHTAGSYWIYDENEHWNECSCGVELNHGDHNFNNGFCTICGYEYGTTVFWAINIANNRYYRVYTKLLAANDICEVWVETTSGVSASTAENIALEYKNNIYNPMISTFGNLIDISSGGNNLNTIEYADYLADRNGKLTILLLDIIDGYQQPGDAYVAGYFTYADLYEDRIYGRSNERDMIYLDTYPSLNHGVEYLYGTLAHELQHLMNFVSSSVYRKVAGGNNFYQMDLWIDEGLSESAEWVYSGEQKLDRISWYNEDRTGFLSWGDNFYLWDNYNYPEDYGDDASLAVLNDYATVYLFFQWLRLQTGLYNPGISDIYWNIISSSKHNYEAIDNLLVTQWWETLEYWHAANFINSPDQIWGYLSDPVLGIGENKIKAHHFDSSRYEDPTEWSLFPGEAVYTYSALGINSLPTKGNSSFIRYKGLSSLGRSDLVPAGGTLLTYSSETDIYAGLVDVTVTGEAPPTTSIQKSTGRSILSSRFSGSYQISMNDMLRRRGTVSLNSRSLSKPSGKVEYRRNEYFDSLLEDIQGLSRSSSKVIPKKVIH